MKGIGGFEPCTSSVSTQGSALTASRLLDGHASGRAVVEPRLYGADRAGGMRRGKGSSKILFVINSLAGGGAERVFCTLLAHSGEYLRDRSVEVVLLDDDEEAYRLPADIKVTRLGCGHGLLASFWRLRAHMKATRPDAVVSFLTRSNMAAVAAARAIGVPSIINERVNTSAHFSTGRAAMLSRAMVRHFYGKASRILAVSHGVADCLVDDFGVDRTRVGVCYNPLDAEAIAAAARQEPAFPVTRDDIVCAGRLVPNKNFALAIEAFRQQADGALGKARLIVMGKGPLRDELQRQIDTAGLDHRILLPGFCENPHAVIARAGVYLQTSNAEGFPNTLLEAMFLGTPCVATDCPSGPAEILGARAGEAGRFAEGAGGLVVPPNDASACARAITAAMEPAMRERLTEAGRRRAQDFTVARAVRGLWSAIDGAMAGEAS